MNFAYAIVYVADVEASIAFFERALGLKRGMITPDGTFGTLDTGATALCFCRHDVARANVGHDYVAADGSPRPLGTELGFTTADVAGACDRAVAAGATLLAPPKPKPWGQVVAYVRAPDGSLIELCTPMG
jgi:catechol 2,3-dioxygenase-like lactoylglutathione lyase family enzyme